MEPEGSMTDLSGHVSVPCLPGCPQEPATASLGVYILQTHLQPSCWNDFLNANLAILTTT